MYWGAGAREVLHDMDPGVDMHTQLKVLPTSVSHTIVMMYEDTILYLIKIHTLYISMLHVLFAYFILFAQSLKCMVNFCIVIFVIQL